MDPFCLLSNATHSILLLSVQALEDPKNQGYCVVDGAANDVTDAVLRFIVGVCVVGKKDSIWQSVRGTDDSGLALARQGFCDRELKCLDGSFWKLGSEVDDGQGRVRNRNSSGLDILLDGDVSRVPFVGEKPRQSCADLMAQAQPGTMNEKLKRRGEYDALLWRCLAGLSLFPSKTCQMKEVRRKQCKETTNDASQSLPRFPR
jgi:hypothetical protein